MTTVKPPVTVITTCMGRRAHLEMALPTWLREESVRVFVVDYACPDGTGRWIDSLRHPRVSCLSLEPDLVTFSKPVFSKPHALNRALDWLAELPDDHWIVLLDVDTLVEDDHFWDAVGALHPKTMGLITGSEETRDLTGVLAVAIGELRAIGGFDTGMRGWGVEDLDVRVRLYVNGVSPVWIEGHDLLSSIPHDDELRSRYYAEKDLKKSTQANLQRMLQKPLPPGYSLLQDPTIKLLLGAGVPSRDGT